MARRTVWANLTSGLEVFGSVGLYEQDESIAPSSTMAEIVDSTKFQDPFTLALDLTVAEYMFLTRAQARFLMLSHEEMLEEAR